MKLQSLDDINKLIRTVLIRLSQLSGNFVRNALSVYGTSLDKNVEQDVFDSISTTDLLILFENVFDDSDSDMSQEDGDNLLCFKGFASKIIIYGNKSNNLALKILSNLLSDKVRQTLSEQGINLSSVSNPTSFHEFKNEVMWLRTDFEIKFACELTIEQIDISDAFEHINMEIGDTI